MSAPNTNAGAIADALSPSNSMKTRIYAACSQADLSCYDLEDLLDSPHQTVSGNITTMVKLGQLEILPFTKQNKFGNEVRVYRAGPNAPMPRKARQKKS